MAAPDLRMGVNTTKEEQLSRGATANKNYAGLMPHDAGNQFRNFRIWKRARAVGGKRRQGPVVVQQKGAGRGRPHLLEKRRAHVRRFSDANSNAALRLSEH